MKMIILDAASLGEGLNLDVFNAFGDVEIRSYTSGEETTQCIRSADILLTNKVILTQENIKTAGNLKLICTAGTGTNHIDTAFAAKMGIRVCNIAGYSTQSVAQHTFAMLFYLFENLAYYDRYFRSGTYVGDEKFSHYANRFHELHGKRWGIIGMGQIGRRVAELATAFGCQVAYCSTSGNAHADGYSHVDFSQLLETSDIISIHSPLNDHTRGLFDYAALKRMKKDAFLLNLGRGGIIEEEALVKIMKEGHLAGVGLDVLSVEPMSDKSPLLALKDEAKLFITPHIGWAGLESRQRMVQEVYLNIEAFLQGKDRNVVI